MLNSVPIAKNNLARNVVMRHPNTFTCQLFRKSVDRVDSGIMGDNPTMGGLGVIATDDEEDISWAFVGNCFSLQTSDTFGNSLMNEVGDSNNASIDSLRFMIEPEVYGSFKIKDRDVLHVLLGMADSQGQPLVRLAFQIVGLETVNNISPYSQRYVCNRRDDLNLEV